MKAWASAQRTLVVDLTEPCPPIAIDGARVTRVDGPRQWLSFPADTSAGPLVSALAARYPLADLSIQEPDIEDVITRRYAGDLPIDVGPA